MADQLNPFPGPQPYTRADSERFFGRDDMIRKLRYVVLSNRVLTVYGPSGSGKSSLLQAGVVPELQAQRALRVVLLESWPRGIDGGPMALLAGALSEQLAPHALQKALVALPRLGAELPPEIRAAEVERFLKRLGTSDDSLMAAARFSEQTEEELEALRAGLLRAWVLAVLQHAFSEGTRRPLLVVLDQLEQLLENYGEREIAYFVGALEALEGFRGGKLYTILALRGDYLGRWRALLGKRHELTLHTFRVRRLTVAEMIDAVHATLKAGIPKQEWPAERVEALIGEMEAPRVWPTDEPEVEGAYVQIVCRSLWESKDLNRDAARVLRDYLETHLRALGGLEDVSRALLEEQFAPSGIRVPAAREAIVAAFLNASRSEEDAELVLEALSDARILRQHRHQRALFYELGHDRLAQFVYERARQRLEEAEVRKRKNRNFIAIAFLVLLAFSLFFALLWQLTEAEAKSERIKTAEARAKATNASLKAEQERVAREIANAVAAQSQAEKEKAEAEKEKSDAIAAQHNAARLIAEAKAEKSKAQAARILVESALIQKEKSLTEDALRLLAAQTLQDDPWQAVLFLRDVQSPHLFPEWRAEALHLLQRPLPEHVIAPPLQETSGAGALLSEVLFGPSGDWLVAGGSRGTWLWDLKHLDAEPVLLDWRGLDHLTVGPDTVANASGSELWVSRVTRDEDDRLRVDRRFSSAELGQIEDLDFDHTGDRLLIASAANKAWLWDADEPDTKPLFHPAPVRSARFGPQGREFITSTGRQMISWHIDEDSVQRREPIDVEGSVTSVEFIGGRAALLGGLDRLGAPTAWIWFGTGIPHTALSTSDSTLQQIAYSTPGCTAPPSRALLLTDRGSLHTWRLDGTRELGPLKADETTREIALSPDGAWAMVGGASGGTLWRLDSEGSPLDRFSLEGRAIVKASFSCDSSVAATVSADGSLQIWRTDHLGLSRRVEVPCQGGAQPPSEWTPELRGERLYLTHLGTVASVELIEHTSPIQSVGVCRDGALETSDRQGILRRWEFPADETIQERLSASSEGRCLSVAQRVDILKEPQQDAEANHQRCLNPPPQPP